MQSTPQGLGYANGQGEEGKGGTSREHTYRGESKSVSRTEVIKIVLLVELYRLFLKREGRGGENTRCFA